MCRSLDHFPAASVHHARWVQVNLIELGVSVVQFHGQRPLDRTTALAHFRNPELDPLGQADFRPVFVATGSDNWFGGHFAQTLSDATRGAFLHIHLELDGSIDGVMKLGARGSIDRKDV